MLLIWQIIHRLNLSKSIQKYKMYLNKHIHNIKSKTQNAGCQLFMPAVLRLLKNLT